MTEREVHGTLLSDNGSHNRWLARRARAREAGSLCISASVKDSQKAMCRKPVDRESSPAAPSWPPSGSKTPAVADAVRRTSTNWSRWPPVKSREPNVRKLSPPHVSIHRDRIFPFPLRFPAKEGSGCTPPAVGETTTTPVKERGRERLAWPRHPRHDGPVRARRRVPVRRSLGSSPR